MGAVMIEPAARDASGLDCSGNSPSRILIIEDDVEVSNVVRHRLEREGFRVDAVADGRVGLDAVLATRPDLVILDLALPSLDGLSVLSVLRRTSEVPVILLTGRGDEIDRIVGFTAGADDYVVKPFSPRELAARVRAVLRRHRSPPEFARLIFPGLSIDPSTREVLVDEVVVELTSREFDLLVFLASSPRQVFSRPQLLTQVWGSKAEWQDDGTVTEHVYRLRRKIESDPAHPRWITTVRGVGYRFEPEPARRIGARLRA